MDALGKSLAILVAAVVTICVPIVSNSADGAGDLNGLLLYEINPYDNEGVSVYNYGDSNVDLKDYYITDYPSIDPNVNKEGIISFTESIIVEPNSFVVIATNPDVRSNFVDRSGIEVYFLDQSGIMVEGNFALYNSGDDVYLFYGNKIVDAVCYGNTIIDDSTLWASDNSVNDRTDWFIQRHGSEDTDSEEDWFNYIDGLTMYQFDENLKFDAIVTPFLFPDHGGIPVLNTLEDAQTSVSIEIYMITDPNVYALLAQLANRGVEINLLLEGEPLAQGYDPIGDMSEYIQYLINAGGNVRLIGVGDSDVTDRFTYVHAKYAIVDQSKVIITSENWTPSNLNGNIDSDPYSGNDGNRGWGAIVESRDYALFMQSVFDNDFDTKYGDVKDYTSMYPESIAVESMTYEEPDELLLPSHRANVTPVLSNDNSYQAMKHYILNATDRIYTEQQSLGKEFRDLSSISPITFMNDMAKKGVECIAILDDTNSNNMKQVNVINTSSLVSAALFTGPTLHNKGLICDDYVWVSSINWTYDSFNYNRETCVVIESSTISDYFAEHLLKDFYHYYDYEGFKVDITEIKDSYPADTEITFSVTVIPESGDYTYVWDFGDGSDPITTYVPRVAYKPQITGDAQLLTLTVTVNDGNREVTVHKDYTVMSSNGESFLSEYMYILAPLIVIILAMIGAVSRKGKKKRK